MNEVDEYLKKLPEKQRASLQKLREVIKGAVPEGEEAISWQMPAIKYRGKTLVGYAAFKNHLSFFPMSVAVINAFKDELEGLRTSKGTIQFQPDKQLPAALVKKIVKARVKEEKSKRDGKRGKNGSAN